MAWPSILTSFTDPTPSDRLSTTPHSSIETAQNTGIEEVQAFVGTLSSTQGTLMYDIRSANSNGGGHVQTVNKGGTGYTSYTKGDILVASSASALSKLAVGTNGQVLKANSGAAAGINWATQSGKIHIQNNLVNVDSVTSGESSIGAQIFSTSIVGSTMGTSNAIRATSYIRPWVVEAQSVLAIWKYGGNIVASVALTPTATGCVVGKLTHTMIASTVNAQRHIVEVDLRTSNNTDSVNAGPQVSFSPTNPFNPSVGGRVYAQIFSTSSVESSASQTYSGNIRIVSGNGAFMSVVGTIVEAIT